VQVQRLKAVRDRRDPATVAKCLEALRAAAAADDGSSPKPVSRTESGALDLSDNLLALAIDAARAEATVGEISDALESAWGRYQADVRLQSGIYLTEYAQGGAKGQGAAPGEDEVELTRQAAADFERRFGRRPRILVAKMGQDGHDRGARVIASAFADLGFDVDVGPLFQTPEEVARQAVDADVHVVGVSTQAAGHRTLVPALVQCLASEGAGDKMVVAGGVIPESDYSALHKAGVAAIFGPGTRVPTAALDVIAKLAASLEPEDAA